MCLLLGQTKTNLNYNPNIKPEFAKYNQNHVVKILFVYKANINNQLRKTIQQYIHVFNISCRCNSIIHDIYQIQILNVTSRIGRQLPT